MSKRADLESLNDIREAILRIESYVKGMTFARFIKDFKTQDAVVRNLEIIGEAVKNISAALKQQYPKVPWKKLAGVRDRLIHHYFGVNFDIVWTIVSEELMEVSGQIRNIPRKKQ